jgi:hypothetical protein
MSNPRPDRDANRATSKLTSSRSGGWKEGLDFGFWRQPVFKLAPGVLDDTALTINCGPEHTRPSRTDEGSLHPRSSQPKKCCWVEFIGESPDSANSSVVR